MSLTNILNNVARPAGGCCTSLYNAGANGVNWLGRSTKSVASGAGETAGKLWAAVKNFFSTVATKLGVFLVAAKNTIVTGVNQLRAVSLPREAKIVGIGAAVVTTLGAVVGLCCCREKPAVPVVAVAQPAAAVAAGAAQPVAAAAQPVVAAAQPAAVAAQPVAAAQPAPQVAAPVVL